jgi:carbon monoxide dehydrogenase subunit G
MTLSATYPIPAARERVFAALNDPAVLQRLIEGCESFVLRPDGVYEARLKVGLGSVKGTYTGEARIEDVKPPESYRLSVSGRGGSGFVKGVATMRLQEAGTQTDVTCDADVQIGGAIVAVGSRLIEVAARRMMEKFFAKLAAELA